MPTSAPSFYSLYRRSRYRSLHLEHGSGLDERQQEIRQEQRERFTVAAIGFCLKHSKPFRAHFWKQVCRGEGDPELVPGLHTAQIEVEPRDFEDLRIAVKTKAGWQVYVIECKTGASLYPKQHPTKSEWMNPGSGYGVQVWEEEKQRATRIRYIVLGAFERLTLPQRHSTLNMELAAKDWSCLLDSSPPKDELTKDLFDSLAMLSIPEFASRHTTPMKLTKTMEEGAKAHVLIQNLIRSLRVPEGSIETDIRHQPDGYWCLGVSIKKPRLGFKVEGFRGLDAALGADDPSDSFGWLAWIGYESRAGHGFVRYAELYCRRSRLTRVKESLSNKGFSCSEIQELEWGETFAIRSAADETRLDTKWFHDVLNAVGVGTKV